MNWEQLAKDLAQKYHDCYCHILLENHTVPELFICNAVEAREKKSPLLYFENEDVGEIVLRYDDSKSDIDWSLPKVGLFEYKGHVIMARRRYERQWKAGCGSSTMNFRHIYARLHPFFEVENPWHEACVKAAYAPKPSISLSEGLNKLRKEQLAVVLSNEFAIGLSPTSKFLHPILWYCENPVAVVNTTEQTIWVREYQFKQEVTDFAKTSAAAYEIHI